MKIILKTISLTLILTMLLSTTVLAAPNEEIVDASKHTYSYTEMCEDLNLLAEKYPEKMSLSTIGTSVDGRAIYQVVLGNPNAKNAIFIMSTIHGREWMNTWVLMDSLEMNLQNWDTFAPNGETYGNVFADCCIYFVPMVNPDGVTISQYGIDAINNENLRNNLKNMHGASNPSRWKANANGVDLNRNFSTGWGSQVDVTAPCADFYNGTAPFTEPETLAIKDALNQRAFTVAITYHSMEGAIYWDLGQEGPMRDKTLALATHCKNITGYRLGEASPLKGLEYNYMNFAKNIPTVCIETGTVQCPLPYSQRSKLWKQNHMMMVTLAGCYQ